MKQLLKYLKNYKKECFLAPLFKMIEATFELLVPLVIKDIINTGIKSQDTNFIIGRVLILIGFAIIGFICAITAQYFSAKAATGFAKEVKHALFEHIESLSFQDLDGLGTSSLITRMTSDINQMQTGINMFLRLFLRSPFVVFGAMIMAFIVNVKTALVFVVTIPLLSVVVLVLMWLSIPLFKKAQAKLDRLLKKTRENLKGVRVIRAFCDEENETKQFLEGNKDLTKFQIFVGKISALMNPITYVIINFAIVAIIYFGGQEVANNHMLQGDVVAQYNYMSQILVELIKLANLTITLTKAIACGKRIQSVFEMKCSQDFPEKTTLEKRTDIAVSMKNVSLCYQKNQANSIENVTIEVKEGSTIGIIGGTGSGKTTLVNLLPRFYDRSSGEIDLFGTPIDQFSKNDLRTMVGSVMQKAVLFKGTIRENLQYANPKKITDEEIWKALEIAQATDVVKGKAEGLDTMIVQGGKNLSGGQKQRLSIARTLLQHPEILILDDSSSALDYLTDAKLRKAIRTMENHPTLFIVSQRAASVMDCDQIIVLDQGKVVGLGKHEALLESSTVYQEIYYSQFKKEETE